MMRISKPNLGTCAQSMALGTRTKFQLEILLRSMIYTIHKFCENILKSSQDVSEPLPGAYHQPEPQISTAAIQPPTLPA